MKFDRVPVRRIVLDVDFKDGKLSKHVLEYSDTVIHMRGTQCRILKDRTGATSLDEWFSVDELPIRLPYFQTDLPSDAAKKYQGY